jgi:Predicted Rossmann fold nucleotide-binding protein
MGVIAEEIVACGGRHVGVIPRFMESLVCDGLSEVVWTDTMDERKLRMRDGVSVALALPGGIGTLDELIGTLTVAKLDVYKGKVVALNIDGFYDPLKALLDHYVATGMLDEPSRELVEFPESVEELTSILSRNQ